jgi:hypothetical protein
MRFLSEEEIDQFDVQSIPSDEVIDIPYRFQEYNLIHLHDNHNDYQLAPGHKIGTDEELSPFSRELLRSLYTDDSENKSEKKPRE